MFSGLVADASRGAGLLCELPESVYRVVEDLRRAAGTGVKASNTG
jgi:hypothetical protein